MAFKLYVVIFILCFNTFSPIVVSTSRGLNSNVNIDQDLPNQVVTDIEINDYSPPRANPGHDPKLPPPASSVLTMIEYNHD
ncbi:hypothetical protein LIER_33721 [Lithospermum erythrorhizon]|uniref:Uncharacterized protein n=1 Tax=Lithospermum erythrorhizon TaxID=34254 RepID=A0AAV3RXH4_LITER